MVYQHKMPHSRVISMRCNQSPANCTDVQVSKYRNVHVLAWQPQHTSSLPSRTSAQCHCLLTHQPPYAKLFLGSYTCTNMSRINKGEGPTVCLFLVVHGVSVKCSVEGFGCWRWGNIINAAAIYYCFRRVASIDHVSSWNRRTFVFFFFCMQFVFCGGWFPFR